MRSRAGHTIRMETAMTMMTTKRIILAFCFVFSAVYIHGQETDFGLWLEVNTKFGLLKNLYGSFSVSQRTFNNTSQIEQGFAEAGLQYRISRNFSVSGSYRLIKNIEDDSRYYYRNKMFVDLRYSQPFSNLKMSARLRVQRTVKTYIEDDDDLQAKYYVRLRLKSEYIIPSFPVSPFAYFESFTPVFADSGIETDKYRVAAGAEVKISRRSSFEAGYLYQHKFDDNTVRSHIMSLGYNLKF